MIPVLVIHMIFTFDHRKECHGDKTMDFKWLAITIPAKHHEQSAGFILCGRQELTATLSFSTIHALDGINSAYGTCRINSFPSWYRIQCLMWQQIHVYTCALTTIARLCTAPASCACTVMPGKYRAVRSACNWSATFGTMML